ncbi:trihelix transcription factor PTL-like [Typha latifolia]|uniref:trihelix transcription factor PTL-like n=1 Tax=Typha latifolia TaxID=4733 RepID=UPI003C2B33EB
MEIGEHYTLPELQHLMAGKQQYASIFDASDHYGMLVMPNTSQAAVAADVELSSSLPPLPPPTTRPPGDLYGDGGGGGYSGNCQGRWPRQETLTLLEVRSRLDSKFREAAQKAPLWDEVSRIMAEEHGYQRSGKKCREKLDNLYKYYKKTKEGKAGRHDGKHYRFFKQLDALYGGNTNTITVDTKPSSNTTKTSSPQATQEASQPPVIQESISLSNSTESDTSTEYEEEGDRKRSRKSWKLKIKELIDVQIKRFLEVQEAWLGKMLTSLEQMEQERVSKEEAWRRQETERFEVEQRQWASERAWVEARDTAILETLERISSGHKTSIESPNRG